MENSILYVQKDTWYTCCGKNLVFLWTRGEEEMKRSRPTITRLDGVCRRNDDPLV